MEKGEDKGIGWVDLAVDHGESGEVELVGSEGGRVARLRQHLRRLVQVACGKREGDHGDCLATAAPSGSDHGRDGALQGRAGDCARWPERAVSGMGGLKRRAPSVNEGRKKSRLELMRIA